MGVVKGLRSTTVEGAAASKTHKPQGRASSIPLPGGLIETPYGEVWVERCHYPAETRQGAYVLRELAAVSEEAHTLLGVPDLGPRPAFLDTETTGLARGAGTLAFLIGVGVWEGEALTLHLVFLQDPAQEAGALRYVADVLDKASGLVTFNGLGFDVPILESRFILNRLPPRWSTLPHLDLLSTARSLWRDHLSSRRLIVLEDEILEIVRDEEDVPSWMIPALYRQYLAEGETSEMARVFYHNRVDVLSLVSLLVHVARLVEAPESLTPAAAEWVGLGRIYQKAGHQARALAAWERAVAGEDGELEPDTATRVWREIGLYYKRDEDWSRALEVWQAWAAQLPWDIEPFVERAKYYEWKARDCSAALVETERALRRARAYPHGRQRLRCLATLQHRRERLLAKIDRA
jgi:hypothetical protein